MKNLLFLATIFLMVVTGSLGGRITAWADPDITNPNTGRVNSMNLYFSLDNRLPAGHVMRVTLPFATSPAIAATGAVIYTAASGSKGAFLSTTTLTASATSTQAKPSTAAPFHNYFIFGAELSAATNYVLKLTFGTVPTDAAGFLGFVQMETMSPAQSVAVLASSATDSAITYDLNNAFAPIQIFAAPNNMTAFTITSDTNATAPGVASLRQFTFTPTQNFFYWPLIQITWDNANLAISSIVSHDTGANSTNLTQFTYGSGTNQFYTTSPNNLTLNIFHNAPLFTSQTIKYNITTQNPSPAAATSINFQVKIMHRYNLNLTDISSTQPISITAVVASAAASSTSISINAYQILLSWGIDQTTVVGATATNPLGKIFTLYATTADNKIFQAVRWVFGVNNTLASGSYNVNVTVCNTAANCDVLENSLVNANMTGPVCTYAYGYSVSGNKIISCNVTGLATTGNMIGARIWLLSTGVMSSPGINQTFNDAGFGKITIYSIATATQTYGATALATVLITDTVASKYNVVSLNALPLANINGNGPLAAIPTNGTTFNAVAATSTYANLWSNAATTSVGANTGTATNFPTCAVPIGNGAGTACTGAAFGGIYGPTGANTKFNLALFTTSLMMATSNNQYGMAVTAGATTTGQFPGIDIFLNPNIWTHGTAPASGTSAIINSCFANNIPKKIITGTIPSFYSNTVDAANTMQAFCFSNLPTTPNASYLRLRWAATTGASGAAIIGTGGMATTIETDLTGPKLLSFFWESAVTMTSNYTGASLKADTNVGDFYGVLWSYNSTSANYPKASAASVSPVPTDSGEINSLTTGLTLNFGTPFMWTQMIMGPYSAFAFTTTEYYSKKQVFLSGYGGFTTSSPANFTANNVAMTLRIRGNLAGTNDANLFPSTGGRMAIFIGTLAGGTVLEPLGGIGTTNLLGATGYNSQTSLTTGVTVPLLGNGNIRCWNAGATASCSLDRYGRVPTATITPYLTNTANNQGIANLIDLYEIISTNITFSTGNFSLSILMKPQSSVLATDWNKYLYRFGFVSSTGNYYIQSWDQTFDNGATLTNTGSGAVFTVNAGQTVQNPTSTTCVLPYVAASSTSSPGVRIAPNSGDLDNAYAASAVQLNVQLASTATFASATKFQGQVIWCVQWNFAQNLTAIAASALENTTALADKCATFDYQSYDASNITNFYCLYCPISQTTGIPAAAGTPTNVTLTNFYDGPAINIPTGVMSNIANDVGLLIENSYCSSLSVTSSSLWTAQTITILNPPSSYYAISGQKITIGFNAPSGLASTMVDTITFSGKVSGAATPDSTFPYGSLDTNSVCRLVPTASISNYTAYLRCTAAINGGVITINGIDTISSASITGYTLYIWGFIGGTAAVNTTAYYVMQTYKTSATFIVDQTNTTNTAYATWTLANSTAALTTTLGGYQRATIGARGYFRIDVAMTGRNWFYSDKVVLNIDAIASASVNSNASVIKCRITDTTSAENIHYGFQSCSYTNGSTPTITIIGMAPLGSTYPYDISTSSGVRVYLDNVVTVAQQANKTIWGNVYFIGNTSSSSGSTILTKSPVNVTDVNPNNLSSTQAFPSGYPTITKWWYSANDFQEINFNLITATVFNSSCRITVAFPSYYNPGLATHSTQPYCTINNAYVQCAVGVVSPTGAVTLQQAQRQLVVWGYGGSAVSANASFVLRVSGISAPPATYVAETFWIQINGDNTDVNTTVIYAGTATDANYATPATISPLNVIWYGVGSTATRTLTSFTWSVYLNNATATVNVSSAVQIIFPENWGLAWGAFAPTCQVTDFTTAATTYTAAISASTGNNSIFGNLVNLNVTTAIPAGSLFNVTCSGVRTGNNDGTYRSQDVTLRVVDASGTFTWFRSASGQHNVNYTAAFAKQSSQSYLSWTASATGNFNTPVPLTAGTFNAPLKINVPSTSSRSFMITVSTANFAFLTTTTPFWVTTGAVSNTTALGCSGSVAAGLYAVNFAVSDNSSLYLAPGPLYVWVNNNAQSISPSATTLTTYFQSTSVTSMTAPLTFDLTNFPPYSDITITPNLTSLGNTNFTFSPSSIKLTAANPKGYFTFSSTSSASATGSANYAFALSGTNAASYSVASSVTVSLTADSGSNAVSTPVLAIIADSTDTGLATTKVITFTLTQVTAATIYWVVTLQGQAITDATTIMTNAAALTQYTSNSANQAQYGSTFFVASSKTSFTISNLFPYTGYTVSAVAVSQTNKNSTVASYTFVTGANAAAVQRWLFNYTAGTYPSQSVRQTLLCTITQTLAVPAINVRNVHGEICGNTTAFYSTSNTTYGDLGMYFYPLQATTDTTMTATNLAALLNGTTTLGTLNNTLNAATANTGFLSILPDLTYIPRQAPNVSIPSSIPSASLTTASINFALSSVNETGFLFVALCSNSSTAPTAIQMKQAAANLSSITGLISLQVFYYYPGAVPTYNFTGLSAATSYNVYVTASNNDPSFLQNFTSVTSISVTTPTTGTTTGAGQMGVMFSVIAIFASIISLMFF